MIAVDGKYVLRLPIKYFVAEEGSDEFKSKISFEKAASELIRGDRECICLPAVTDDCGKYLFNLEYVGPNK